MKLSLGLDDLGARVGVCWEAVKPEVWRAAAQQRQVRVRADRAHHLTPRGLDGFLFGDGSAPSSKSFDDLIRKHLIEVDHGLHGRAAEPRLD